MDFRHLQEFTLYVGLIISISIKQNRSQLERLINTPKSTHLVYDRNFLIVTPPRILGITIVIAHNVASAALGQGQGLNSLSPRGLYLKFTTLTWSPLICLMTALLVKIRGRRQGSRRILHTYKSSILLTENRSVFPWETTTWLIGSEK